MKRQCTITSSPQEAALLVKNPGAVVIFPTETVYGIGAAANDFLAVERVYAIKKRPQDNPLIVHTACFDELQELIVVESFYHDLLRDIAESAALTLVGKKRRKDIFSNQLDTLGVRIPHLNLAKEFIAAAGVPIAAPSANFSGSPSITYPEEAVRVFEGHVDAILLGPPCRIGVESTVLDISGLQPCYLRPGEVSFEALQERIPSITRPKKGRECLLSPGMRYRHYQPEAKVWLVNDLTAIQDAHSGQIGFNIFHKTALDVKVENNQEYAKKLFWFFIQGDRLGLKNLYCQMPKQEDPLYEALWNRMYRAHSEVR